MATNDKVAAALQGAFLSETLCNGNANPANVTDALAAVAESAKKIADAITSGNASAGHDALGGHVESLTEAVMGVTGALSRIADGLHAIAEAIREHG